MARHIVENDLANIFAKVQRDFQKRWETEPVSATFTRDSIAMRMDGVQVESGQPRYGRWVKKVDTVTMDFKGKTAGNLSVPHMAKFKYDKVFVGPSVFDTEDSQANYDNLASQDNKLRFVGPWVKEEQYPLHLFSFNILQDLKNKGIIPQSWTVNNLKNALKTLKLNWVGYGVGVDNGEIKYKVKTEVWWEDSYWTNGSSITSSVPALVSWTLENGLYNLNKAIDSSGFIHLLVRTFYPSDGINPATLCTDYVSVEVTIERWVKEENGIFIEEGTTNILPAGSENFQTKWEAKDGASVTVTPGQLDPFGGTGAYRIQINGGTSTLKYSCTLFRSIDKTPYSSQMWIRNRSSTTVVIGDNIGNNKYVNSNEWIKVQLQNSIGNGTTYLSLRFQTLTIGDTLDFDVFQPQIEEKPYCTSYTPPGTTRQKEILTIPTTGLSTKEGCWRQWVYIDDMTKRQVTGQYNRVFDLPRINGGNGIALYHRPDINEWCLEVRDNNNTSKTKSVSDKLTPNGWHLFEIRWNAELQIAQLLIDGILAGTIVDAILPLAFSNVGYIGTAANYGLSLNTIHGQVQLLNHFPTDEESLTAYNQGINGLTWDEHTIALYNWDESLSTRPKILSNIQLNPTDHIHTLSQITDAGTAAYKNVGTNPGQVPLINDSGKIETSIIPAVAITDTFVVNSESAMLALNAQIGDVVIRTDLSKTFILTKEPASILSNWQELLVPPDKVQSVNGKTGVITLTASDVGAITSSDLEPIEEDIQIIQNSINDIQNNMNTIQSTANEALTTANTAQTTANNVQSTITSVQTTVSNMQTTVSSIQTTVSSHTSNTTIHRKITFGTTEPSGGSDGDIYFQYEP